MEYRMMAYTHMGMMITYRDFKNYPEFVNCHQTWGEGGIWDTSAFNKEIGVERDSGDNVMAQKFHSMFVYVEFRKA